MKFAVIVNGTATGYIVEGKDSGEAIEKMIGEYRKHRIDVREVITYQLVGEI
jgi:hypothetical protein